MFTERFNELLGDVCYVSTMEFARIGKYDRSYVAHLKNGDRVPRPGLQASSRLARAIYDCAVEKNAVPRLCERVGAPPAADADEICAAVSAWMLEGEARPPRKPRGNTRHRARAKMTGFNRKLNAAMDIAGVSTQRLAKALNVDTTLIGKYRSGMRVPRINHPLIHEIAAVLASHIYSAGRGAELARMIGIAPEERLTGPEGARRLEQWLCDFDSVDTSLVEQFLDDLDSFSAETAPPLMSPEEAAGTAGDDTEEFYWGIDGLRRAVLRFLYTAIRDRKRQLLLYSDQNMDWMVGDRDFSIRWASLMIAYVGMGGKIQIIHNVDRGLEEMLSAIRSWLPLYLSGKIESWYCVKQGGERFSRTMFLEPEGACISGDYIAGREQLARYRYMTEKAELAYCGQWYDSLLADSRGLFRFEPEGLRGCLSVIRRDREIHQVSNTLSLATMPGELLERILDRAAPPEGVRQEIVSRWAESSALLLRKLEGGSVVHECVPLPDTADLLAGKIPVDTEQAGLFYTREEYAEHLSRVIALAEENGRYRFHPLTDAPFGRIRLVASAHTATFCYCAGRPVAFAASHPLMCRAFANFAERLEEQYHADCQTVRESLSRSGLLPRA